MRAATGGFKSLVVLVSLCLLGCGESSLRHALTQFEVEPRQLDFGPTHLSRPGSLELTVTNNGRTDLSVRDITSSLSNVSVADFAPFTLAAGQRRTLTAVFKPAAEGKISGAFDFKVDAPDDSGSSRVAIAGVGVKGYLQVKTRTLDFGNVELDTNKVLEIQVKNPTAVASPLLMRFEGSDADAFSSSVAGSELLLAGGEERTVAIAFKPGRLGLAEAVAKLDVCTGCEKLSVDLSGSGIAAQLEITPLRLDFGKLTVGATAEQRVTIRNLGVVPFDYGGVRLLNNTGAFSITRVPTVPNSKLQPNAQAEVTVAFTPSAAGAVKGALLELRVFPPDATGSAPKIPLSGEGGASCVTVSPRALDFGTVPEGMSFTRRVEVLNRCSGEVEISGPSLVTTSGGYFTFPTSAGGFSISPGQKGAIDVTYLPKRGSTTSAGTLSFRVLEGSGAATEVVTLSGDTRAAPPCTYSLVPSAVDFGNVPVGGEVTLGVALNNTGTERCFVSNMQLVSGSDAAFSIDAPVGGWVEPGKQRVLPVKFRPTATASYGGMVELWVNHLTAGHPTISLSGTGVTSCFSLQPGDVDFGTTLLTCGTRTRTVVALNGCSSAVRISSVSIGASTSNEFSVTSPLALPFNLAANASVSFQVRYAPGNDGEDFAALYVNAGLGGLSSVGLRGKGSSKSTQTDVFFQENQAKVDVLWVVDNSGSLYEEQQGLARNFASFLASAQERGTDYHIAVTTTGIQPILGSWAGCPGGAEGGEAGRLFPVNSERPRIITPATPNAADVFAANVQVGLCHWDEQGLMAAKLALSSPLVNSADDLSTPMFGDGNAGFLRSDARLAVIFLSDEEDASPGTVQSYETFFKSLKNNDPSMLSISAIVGPRNLAECPTASTSGSRYISLAESTAGVVENICTPNWADSLKTLSSSAFGARRSFTLSERPRSAPEINVTVNGTVVTGWTYDSSTNAVVFTQASAPAAGSVVEVTYRLGC